MIFSCTGQHGPIGAKADGSHPIAVPLKGGQALPATSAQNLGDIPPWTFAVVNPDDVCFSVVAGEVVEFTGYKKNLASVPVDLLTGNGFMVTSVIDEDGWKELADLTFVVPKLDAQQEIRELCDLIWPHLQSWAPEIASWYEQSRLHKARLAP